MATLRNCSNRFRGKNVKILYLDVITTLFWRGDNKWRQVGTGGETQMTEGAVTETDMVSVAYYKKQKGIFSSVAR